MLHSDAGVRLALATALAFCSTVPALSHGIVGNRFFPATITTDDPFAADELSLPTVSYQNTGIDPSVKETDINGEFSKRITPDIGSRSRRAGPTWVNKARRATRAAGRTSSWGCDGNS